MSRLIRTLVLRALAPDVRELLARLRAHEQEVAAIHAGLRLVDRGLGDVRARVDEHDLTGGRRAAR